MPTDNDPLAEDEGPCTKCDGGWITVQPAYAIHLYPDPTLEQLADLPPEVVEALAAQRESNRRAAANSVYPCRRCKTALFFRWAGGHLKMEHDALSCDECIEVMGGRRAARRAARSMPEHTPRRDTDG